MPASTRRTTGGMREDDRGDDRREAARPEQRDGRQQVDERRHRLGEVEQRPEHRREPPVARRQDPEATRPMSERQRGRDEDRGERLHRVLPEAERGHEQQATAAIAGRPPAADERAAKEHEADDSQHGDWSGRSGAG